jgi:ribosomal protein S18 acetylase RimI-like enzyme
MVQLIVRPAAAEDAEAVGRLAAEFAQYLRSLGDKADLKFDADTYLRDGFGESPAFSGLVAERGDEILGYLLYHPGYDVDYAARTLHVVDLYVGGAWRGQGVGRALMREAVRVCRRMGGAQLFWAVYAPNKAAIGFYEHLGARFTQDLLFMRLDVEA